MRQLWAGSNSLWHQHIFVHHLQSPGRSCMDGREHTACGGRLYAAPPQMERDEAEEHEREKTAPLITPWESNNTNFLKLSDWFTFVISSMNIGSFIHAKDWFCFMYKNSTKTFLKFSTYWCHKCIVSFFVTWWILYRFMGRMTITQQMEEIVR